MDGCLDSQIERLIDGWLDGLNGRWLDEWVDGQKAKNGWMNECTDWLNGQMDIQMFEWMAR